MRTVHFLGGPHNGQTMIVPRYEPVYKLYEPESPEARLLDEPIESPQNIHSYVHYLTQTSCSYYRHVE